MKITINSLFVTITYLFSAALLLYSFPERAHVLHMNLRWRWFHESMSMLNLQHLLGDLNLHVSHNIESRTQHLSQTQHGKIPLKQSYRSSRLKMFIC